MQPVSRETAWRFDRSNSWIPPTRDLAPQQNAQTQRKRQSALCCAHCGQWVTEHAARMEFAGAHQHIFTNPGGYTYDIALFTDADCVHQGPATMEFTWFNGFSWQLALCRNCCIHLGWHYVRTGDNGFYGLIRSRLVDVDAQ